MRYDQSKSEATTGSLWDVQTNTAKKDCFTKILSPPRFFKINTSNFQEMFYKGTVPESLRSLGQKMKEEIDFK